MELRRAIIFTKDLESMREFYRDKLGLRPIPGADEAGWVEFEAGTSRVALHAIPRPLADVVSIAEPPQPREETPIKLVFVVSDVNAERSRLVEQGVTMFAVKSWGACDGVDPEGNVFQLATK